MKTTKLIHATNPDTDKVAITQRLTDHLMNLRKIRLAADFIGDDEHSIDLGLGDFDNVADELSKGIELTWTDNHRIKQRVQRIADRRKEASGLAHFKDGEINRLRPLFAGAKLLEPKCEHWVDEQIAALHEEMPWMAPATNEVWSALRHSAATGDIIGISPLLLNGPPGIGKSYWARRLAELLHIPRCEIDASLGGVGFSVAGTERGWSTAQAGRPLETILQYSVGNPLVVVDEICKAQSVTSDKGASHSFANTLLSLMEPATSTAWECPYYRTKIDMSHISWILTANDASLVPEPLLSRCSVINLTAISYIHLKGFALQQAKKLPLTNTSLEVLEEVIERTVMSAKSNVSLRDVIRIVRLAEALEQRPMYH